MTPAEQMLMAIFLNGGPDLTKQEIEMLDQPKATWPPELRKKLAPYGGEGMP